MILPKQQAFLERVFEIPFKERSWKRLVTLDTFHAFSGGPIPSKKARQLDRISRVRKYSSSSPSFCFGSPFYLFIQSLVSKMDSFKNKQAAKNRQKEIKKAAALRAQGGGSSVMPPYASKKRKYPFELQSSRKNATSPSIRSEAREVTTNIPRHSVGKGIMTS